MVSGSTGTHPEKLQGLNTIEEVFKLNLKDAVDSTNLNVWSYNIPVLSANEKDIVMEILGG